MPRQPTVRVKERIRAETENAALNLFFAAKEAWVDFRASGRIFKLKVLVVGSWLLLSAAGFVVACPGRPGPDNSLGAELVIAGDPEQPVFMIQNGSSDPWEEVTVVVNGSYRLSVALMAPGTDVTFGPKQLLGPNGKLAPADLRVTEIELRTDDGKARLMREGQVQ